MRALWRVLWLGAAAACAEPEPGLAVAELREVVHPGALHEVHVSEPALAAAPDGAPLLAWIRGDSEGRHVWVQRVAAGGALEAVRVDPPELAVASGHQPPGLAVAADGAIHVSWSSRRARAESPFASDLRLSSSRDGGRSFAAPLRVSPDAPGSRGFEGLAVDAAGTVLLAWIESGGAHGATATLLARIDAGGQPLGPAQRIGARTCPCCRVAVAAGSWPSVAVLWRDELPGAVRDMVLARSRDGGETFAEPALVHADGWSLAACPHRGGALALDAQGGALAAWYTEGAAGKPELRLARAEAQAPFGAPRSLHELPGSQPDRVALALRPDGTGLLAWESATPVRRDIAARLVFDGGRRLGRAQILSRAVQARGPAVVALSSGDFAVAWNEEAFPSLRSVVAFVSPR